MDALLDARKPLPDGAQWVEYAQPAKSLVHELAQSPHAGPPAVKQAAAKRIVFRLCRRIPIPMSQAVALARAYRDVAVGIYRGATSGTHSLTLTGLEQDGSIALGNRHLYYLPQTRGGRSELAVLVLTVPPGTLLDQDELDALLSVERLVLDEGDRYPITLVPEHVGDAEVVPARSWVSMTPFLPARRHRAGRTTNVPELQLASYLQRSCGVAPAGVSTTRGPAGTGVRTPVRAHEYGSPAIPPSRPTKWRLTRRLGHWFTVEFQAPVVIGLPVGADAHFGLGQFAPIDQG